MHNPKFLNTDKNFAFSVDKYYTCSILLDFNPLNAELNPICHSLALSAHHIFHVSGIRVNDNITAEFQGFVYQLELK